MEMWCHHLTSGWSSAFGPPLTSQQIPLLSGMPGHCHLECKSIAHFLQSNTPLMHIEQTHVCTMITRISGVIIESFHQADWGTGRRISWPHSDYPIGDRMTMTEMMTTMTMVMQGENWQIIELKKWDSIWWKQATTDEKLWTDNTW